MDEHKELIYTGEAEKERIDPFLPPCLEENVATESHAPRRQRGMFSGLAIGVALFAAAFLLCDGFYALRAHVGTSVLPSDESADWLAQLLGGSFIATQTEDTSPDATGRVPGTETSSTEETRRNEEQETAETPSATTVGSDDVPVPPALTPEELYACDPTSVPQGMIPIVPMDLSLSGYGEAFHYNDTSYSLTLGDIALSANAVPTVAEMGQVSVLIVHTHATEGYSAEGASYYDPATPLARADDPSTGVIAVGKVIADILNRNGIVTLHSTVLHDKDSYKDSYSRSAKTVQDYLAQYPSIRLVIDVHRDSIMTSGDQLVRPVTVVDGEAVAQVMCVVGSDASGADYRDWQKNLALAVALRKALNGDYGTLCRPVYVKRSAYNQQYAPSSLLLEIGSSGNSLDEANRAAVLVAEEIVRMMKGDPH